MIEISINKDLEAVIRGEFWDIDRLYFAIERVTGNYGIERKCPYPDIEKACGYLLGLNYEFRHAMSGYREIYEQYNGIPDHWLSETKCSESKDFSSISNLKRDKERTERENRISRFEDELISTDIDLDEFSEMDREDQEDLLIDCGFDPDEYEEYFDDLDAEYADMCPFSKNDFPKATDTNTWLQVRIPFTDALFYALIIREIIARKDQYFAYMKDLLDDPENTLTGLEEEYFYTGMQSDICRMTIFMEKIFKEFYRLAGKESFIKYINGNLTDSDLYVDDHIDEICRISDMYSKLTVSGEGSSQYERKEQLIDEYLRKLGGRINSENFS